VKFKIDPELFFKAQDSLSFACEDLKKLKTLILECVSSYPKDYKYKSEINNINSNVIKIEKDISDLMITVNNTQKNLMSKDVTFSVNFYNAAANKFNGSMLPLNQEQINYINNVTKEGNKAYTDLMIKELTDLKNQGALNQEQIVYLEQLIAMRDYDKEYDNNLLELDKYKLELSKLADNDPKRKELEDKIYNLQVAIQGYELGKKTVAMDSEAIKVEIEYLEQQLKNISTDDEKQIITIKLNILTQLQKEKDNVEFESKYNEMLSDPEFQKFVEEGKKLSRCFDNTGVYHAPQKDSQGNLIYYSETPRISGVSDDWAYERYLTSEQIDMYYYMLAKNNSFSDGINVTHDGYKLAKEYINHYKQEVNYSWGAELGESQKNAYNNANLIGKTFMILGSSYQQGFSGFFKGANATFDKILGNEIDTTVTADEISAGEFRENIAYDENGNYRGHGSKFVQYWYDANKVTANMIPSMAVGIGTVGQFLSAASIWSQSYGNNYKEKINAGYSDYLASNYARKSATADMILEKVLSAVPGIGMNLGKKILPGKLGGLVLDKFIDAAGEIIQNKASLYYGNAILLEKNDLSIIEIDENGKRRLKQEDIDTAIVSLISSSSLSGVSDIISISDIKDVEANISQHVHSATTANISFGELINQVNNGQTDLLTQGLSIMHDTAKVDFFNQLDDKTLNNFVSNFSSTDHNLIRIIGLQNLDSIIPRLNNDNVSKVLNSTDIRIFDALNLSNKSKNKIDIVLDNKSSTITRKGLYGEFAEQLGTNLPNPTDSNKIISETVTQNTKYADDNVVIDGMSCHMIMPELLIENLNNKGIRDVFTIQDGVYILKDVDASTKFQVLNAITDFVSASVGQMVLDDEVALDAWNIGVGKDLNFQANFAEFLFEKGKVEQANVMLTKLISKINDFRQELVLGSKDVKTETVEDLQKVNTSDLFGVVEEVKTILEEETRDNTVETTTNYLMTNEEFIASLPINDDIREFLIRNNIDVRAILSNKESIIFTPKEHVLRDDLDENLIITPVTEHVSIADITAENDDPNAQSDDIIGFLNSLFDSTGSDIQTRSLGMLKYNANNIISSLQTSFSKETIHVGQTTDGKYMITNNGRHRFALMKLLYLDEVNKATSIEEINQIKEKYTIPVTINKVDLDRSACKNIIETINPNLEVNYSEMGLSIKDTSKSRFVELTIEETIEYIHNLINNTNNQNLILNSNLDYVKSFISKYDVLNTKPNTKYLQELNSKYEYSNIGDFLSEIKLDTREGFIKIGNVELRLNNINKLFEFMMECGINPENINATQLSEQQIIDICNIIMYSTPYFVENIEGEIVDLREEYVNKIENTSDILQKINIATSFIIDISNLIIEDSNLDIETDNMIRNMVLYNVNNNNNNSINDIDISLSSEEWRIVSDILQNTDGLRWFDYKLSFKAKKVLKKYLQSGAAKTLLSLTYDEYKSLMYYGGGNYSLINQYLKDGKNVELSYMGYSDLKDLAFNLENLMQKNKISKTFIFQRATTISEFEGLSLNEIIGKILTQNRFKSTCIDPINLIGTKKGGMGLYAVDDEQKVKIDYICPAGTKVVNLGMITGNPIEREALLGNNQRIRYDAVKMDGDIVCVLAVVLPEGVPDNISIKELVDTETYNLISDRYDLKDNSAKAQVYQHMENKYGGKGELQTKWAGEFVEYFEKHNVSQTEIKRIQDILLSDLNLGNMFNKGSFYFMNENASNSSGGMKAFFSYLNSIEDRITPEYLKEAIDFVTSNLDENCNVIDAFIKYIVVTNFDDLNFNSTFSNLNNIGDEGKIVCTLGDFQLSKVDVGIFDENYIYFDFLETRPNLKNSSIGSVLLKKLATEVYNAFPNKNLVAFSVLRHNIGGIRFYEKNGGKFFELTNVDELLTSKEIDYTLDEREIGVIFDRQVLKKLSEKRIDAPKIENGKIKKNNIDEQIELPKFIDNSIK